MARLDIRLDDKTKEDGENQAKNLGLSLSDYIRLIIKLDVMTNIVKRLNEEKS
jgi:antitoxin component of RelBE/YafQ-DinJ toxin-antitoxin module